MRFSRMIPGMVVAMGMALSMAAADEAKQATLEGKMTCAKCGLGEGSKCADVLVVKEGEKETRYAVALSDDTKDKHVCRGEKNVKVTGTITEKDGVKTIAATKIEPVKAE